MKTLLIDGNAMLNVFYYGSLPNILRNKDNPIFYDQIEKNSMGIYVNAIKPFMKMVISFYQKLQVDHVAIGFDIGTETYRKQHYDFYKAQRTGTPLPLKEQIDFLYFNLKKMGFPAFADELWEGDDIIATLAKQSIVSPSDKTYIITTDHDYFQMATENVNILLYIPNAQKAEILKAKYPKNFITRKYFIYDQSMIFAEEHVLPIQIPDLKGLSGDTSDNIPGVNGIGEKTAISLLEIFGNVENIYTGVDNLSEDYMINGLKTKGVSRAKLVYNKIKEGRESALMCKQIATVNNQVQLPQSDLQLHLNQHYNVFMNNL